MPPTPGTQMEVLPPSGVFTPKAFDQPLLLIAAGSGVTPVMSILKTALATSDSQIVFFYANRSSDDVIFAAELRELHAAHADRLTLIHWLENLQGFVWSKKKMLSQLTEKTSLISTTKLLTVKVT